MITGCVLALTLSLAAPRDELLRYVPDEAGFCVVATDLGGKAASLRDSPFLAALLRSPLGRGLAGAKEWSELKKIEQNLSRTLGLELTDLADIVPGEAAAFAYQPGPPDRPDLERGLFLLRAKNARSLALLLDKLNAAQKASGELRELISAEHRGVRYVRRIERKEKTAYLLRGPVLVFSGQEEMLKKAIEREATLEMGQYGHFGKRLRSLGDEGGFVHLLLNPRAFDAGFAAARKEAAGKALEGYWKALDGVDLILSGEKDVRLSITLSGDTARLSPVARSLFRDESRPSDVWVSVPESALFALAGQWNVAQLYAAALEFHPPETRAALDKELERFVGAVIGKRVVTEVLPALGPDWGVYALAPGLRETWPRLVVAWKAEGGEAGVDEAVLGALDTWAKMAVLHHNKINPDAPARVVLRSREGTRVRIIEGLPAGVLPTYALREGYLVMTTHPDEVARFKPGRSTGRPVSLMRLSLVRVRDYLTDRREPLATALSNKDGRDRSEVLTRLDTMRDVLGLFDRLDVTLDAGPGRTTFRATLKPAEGLRK